LALLAGAAVAVPATVIARGNANAAGDADRFVAESIGQVETHGSGYHPVGLGLPITTAPVAVTVSAQMTKGKAKFKLVGGSSAPQPNSVLFSAKGSNSFTFGAASGCPRVHLEWKRVGHVQAVAAKVSTLSVHETGPCF
jgi:hypothetical protein